MRTRWPRRSPRLTTLAALAAAVLAVGSVGACSSGSAGQDSTGQKQPTPSVTSTLGGQSSSQSAGQPGVGSTAGSATASAGQPAGGSTDQPVSPSSPAAAASATAAPKTGGGVGCAAIKAGTLKAVFSVPVSAPYSGGSGACWFGIGPNATASGSALETLNSDSFLAQLFPGGGPGQYEYYSTATTTTPLPGVGDKASYKGDGTTVYVLKGAQFCLVGVTLGNSSEIGLPADPDGTVPDADAAKVATKLATICSDFFAAAG